MTVELHLLAAMKLVVRNLGIVDYAEIDLSKDLTLFCGPNGTGKTYVAYLLNALFNLTTEFSLPEDSDIKEFLLRNNVINIKPDYLELWAKSTEDKLKSHLPSIFGISRKEASDMFHSTEIFLRIDDNDCKAIVEVDAKYFYVYRLNSKLELVSTQKVNDKIYLDDFDKADVESSYQKIIAENISFVFQKILLGRNPARMLTVERNSIYTFKTELLANRLETVDNVFIYDNEDAGEIVRQRATLYPKAVRNSLKIANELPEIIKQETEYAEFADEIERDLLLGSVSVGKEGDVRFIPTTSAESTPLTLPIRIASSSVKTLSGLVVYLRHIAKKGDVLIIDEPEMNLHPDNQRRLARIFARMLNKELRLVISTHSDYIIRELNNLVMLKTLQSEGMPLPSFYTDQDTIDKTAMQALLFNFDDSQRAKATPINIDDFGLEVKTIDETIESQNEQTIILRDTLEEYKTL